MAETTPPVDDGARKERSPSFPFISLEKAVRRAKEFAENHKRSPARLVATAPTWGYAVKSSGLLQTVAALKQFGLIDYLGSGDERRVQLTELAWRILLDSRPGAREQALKEAALKPRLIAEYAAHWGGERPSDSHCISELHLDRGFTPDAAKLFLRVFDETVAFANLAKSDNLSASLQHETVEELPLEQGSEPASRIVAAVGMATGQRGAGRGPNRATLPLPEGIAAVEIPEGLSLESYEDLKAWIEVLLNRAGRPSRQTGE